MQLLKSIVRSIDGLVARVQTAEASEADIAKLHLLKSSETRIMAYGAFSGTSYGLDPETPIAVDFTRDLPSRETASEFLPDLNVEYYQSYPRAPADDEQKIANARLWCDTVGYRVIRVLRQARETTTSPLNSTTSLETLPEIVGNASWDFTPSALSTTSVEMVANAILTGLGPIEYLFENVTTATDSGWISSTSYTEEGLTPGETYTYRVKARDATWSESGWSGEESVTLPT